MVCVEGGWVKQDMEGICLEMGVAILYHLHCNNFNSADIVIIAVLIIHANKKYFL